MAPEGIARIRSTRWITLLKVYPPPADKSGLKVGDIITKLDGRDLSEENIGRLLAKYSAGDMVALTILRDGRKKNVELTFGEREKD